MYQFRFEHWSRHNLEWRILVDDDDDDDDGGCDDETLWQCGEDSTGSV
jgi:hypothetical protein